MLKWVSMSGIKCGLVAITDHHNKKLCLLKEEAFMCIYVFTLYIVFWNTNTGCFVEVKRCSIGSTGPNVCHSPNH